MRTPLTKQTLGVLASAAFGFTAVTTAFAMTIENVALAPSGSERPAAIRMSALDRVPTKEITFASEAAFPSEVDILTRTYRWGKKSEAVRALQYILNVPVDGDYGKVTRKAHMERLRLLGLSTENVPTPLVAVMDYGNKQCHQWEDLARQVGWPDSEVKKLSYVTFRESSCRPTAHNTSDPTWAGSRGLMQINGYWCIPNKYNPNGWLQQQGVLSHCDDLFDPAINLKAALLIWKRSGWGPWSL